MNKYKNEIIALAVCALIGFTLGYIVAKPQWGIAVIIPPAVVWMVLLFIQFWNMDGEDDF